MFKRISDFYSGKNKRCKLFFSILLANILYMLVIYLIWEPYLAGNDDMQIMYNISGLETGTPSVYAIFVGVAIAFPLTLLYTIMPSVPWYGILYILVMLFSLTIILFSILKKATNRRQVLFGIFLYIIFILVFASEYLIYIQFTTTSGFAAIAVITILLTVNFKDKKEFFWNFLILGIFSYLSLGIRLEVFLMLMPFMALALFANIFIINKCFKLYKKRIVSTILLIVLSVGGIKGSNLLLELTNKEYAEFCKYREYRAYIVDFYGASDYDVHIDFYTSNGISREIYNNIRNHNFGIEDITTDMLKSIADYSKEIKFSGSISAQIKESMKNVYDIYLSSNTNFAIILLLLLFCICLALNNGKLSFILINVLALLGGFTISTFLIWRMKLPLRLVVNFLWVFYVFLTYSIVMLLSKQKKNQIYLIEASSEKVERIKFAQTSVAKIAVYVIISVFCVMSSTAFQFNITYFNNIDNYKAQLEQIRIVRNEYIANHEENFYFYDVIAFSDISAKAISFDYKMPLNFTCAGGWNAKAPTYNEKLKSNNFESIDDALTNYDNVFYISAYNTYRVLISYFEAKYPNKVAYVEDVIESYNLLVIGIKER